MSQSRQTLMIKGGSFAKRISVCTTPDGRKYILKESEDHESGELRAFRLMEALGVSRFFARVSAGDPDGVASATLVDYVDDDVGSALRSLEEAERAQFWRTIVGQLASVVSTLEARQIQHNDFTPENLRIARDSADGYRVQIIDLETMVDYRDKVVYPVQVVGASRRESRRMGWSRSFHLGADLNQMLGELFRRYRDTVPASLRDALEPRIMVANKEFPFAIHGANPRTSGQAVASVLARMG